MKKILVWFLLVTFFNMYNPILAKSVEVKSGTHIPIITSMMCSSKDFCAGDKLNAVIANDIKIGDYIIFKKGDSANINISDAKKAGFLGIPGEMLLVNGDVVDVNGNKHFIQYNRKITGEEKTYPKVCLAISIFFLWPLALFSFVKGGQAKIHSDSEIDVVLIDGFSFVPTKL